MSKRILVTGGAGFIGSHLVDALLASGLNVRVYDNLEPQIHGSAQPDGAWPDYCNGDAEYVLGDVRDHTRLLAALRDIDAVVHLAARVGVGQSMYEIEAYVDANIRGTAMLLDVVANEPAIRERLTRLVVASSMSNYGEGRYRCPSHGLVSPPLRSPEQLADRDWELHCELPNGAGARCGETLTPVATDESKPLIANSIYAISKKTQEEMVLAVGRAYDLPAVALRFFNTYGTRQALSNPYTGVLAIFAGRLLQGKAPIIFEDGNQVRDFVHVSDIVQGTRLALEHPDAVGEVLNVGSGAPITIRAVAESMADALDTDIAPEITGQYRSGDFRHCYADISRISALGYKPQATYSEALGRLAEWAASQRYTDSFDAMKSELESRGLAR